LPKKIIVEIARGRASSGQMGRRAPAIPIFFERRAMNGKRFRTLAAIGLATLGGGVLWAQAQPAATAGKQFAIMVHETPAEFARRTDPGEGGRAYWAAWGGYFASMRAAGVDRGGVPLQGPQTARVVTVRDGKVVADAPPATGDKPAVSGYFVIEVASMEEAVAWAAKAPNAATSPVEVRPAFPAPQPSPGK
jgi:hypothetical protein